MKKERENKAGFTLTTRRSCPYHSTELQLQIATKWQTLYKHCYNKLQDKLTAAHVATRCMLYLLAVDPESIQVEIAAAERKEFDAVANDVQNLQLRQMAELLRQLTDLVVT